MASRERLRERGASCDDDFLVKSCITCYSG